MSFSGGMDSTYLLEDTLSRFSKNLVHVIHFNHGLRPNDWPLDNAHIKSIEHSVGCPIIIKYLPILAYAKRYGCSVEMAGHYCRRSYLIHVAKLRHISQVLTGHHLDDHCETFIQQIGRSAVSHNQGILSCLEVTRGIMFYRPLLSLSKQAIRKALLLRGSQFITDPTNEQSVYQRNKLRLEGIPKVDAINPNYRQHIQSYALYNQRLYKKAYTRFSPVLDDLILDNVVTKINRSVFQSLNNNDNALLIQHILSLFYRYLSTHNRLIQSLPHRFSRQHVYTLVRLLESSKTGRTSLPGGYEGYLTESHLCIQKKRIEEDVSFSTVLGINSKQVWIDALGVWITCTLGKKQRHDYRSSTFVAYLDGDYLAPDLLVRNRCEGDSFIPFGQTGTKSIKSYFIDKKIPVLKRANVPLFFNQNHLVWVGGFQIDNRYKVTPNTKLVLTISMFK